MMAERYVRGSDLFVDEQGELLSAGAINDVVKAHTSNLQRTLMSSWSLLQGMFPGTPRHFSYMCDRQDVDMIAVERKLEEGGQVGTGIRMVVEPGTGKDGTGKDDMLFHQANRSQHAERFRKVCPLHPAGPTVFRSDGCIALTRSPRRRRSTCRRLISWRWSPTRRLRHCRTSCTR